jgi:hypothetical protein
MVDQGVAERGVMLKFPSLPVPIPRPVSHRQGMTRSILPFLQFWGRIMDSGRSFLSWH